MLDATWCKNWLVHVCQYLACKDGTVQVRSSGRIGLKADFGSNAPWLVKRLPLLFSTTDVKPQED